MTKKSQVFFAAATHDEPAPMLEEKLARLWSRAALGALFHPRDLVAIKLHVGEPGTVTYVPPALAAEIVRQLQAVQARPFLTDTSVLYSSPRNNAVGHALVAHEHGFGVAEVGAPFLPADGLLGDAETEVAIAGKHYTKVAIASGILESRAMVVLSHVTGHLATGLGAALKNLGMGCSAKKAKLRQHHGQQPHINRQACTACGACATSCPSDAITVSDKAAIDPAKCIGCGECIAVCQDGAVAHEWGVMGQELQERIVEHAAGVIKGLGPRIAYVSAALAITKDCDCMGKRQRPLIADIGLLVATDPVAIDQAAWDLVRERAGRTLESMSYPSHDGTLQLAYAEALGLGSREYELVTLAP